MELKKRLLANTFVREVLLAPLEFMQHDSMFRIRVFAYALIVGEPLYYFIWTVVSPQPAESWWIRASSALAALPLAFRKVHRVFEKRKIEYYWVALCFYTLPVGFFCLYLMNGFNDVWMGSCVAMIYVLFHLTDWRIALLEILLAIPVTAWAAWAGLIHVPAGLSGAVPISDIAIMAFALATAVLFSMSSANLRRERARSALLTMGVLAHEFRTPLAAATVITEGLAQADDLKSQRAGFEKLAELHASMNAQIDYQMGNARLMDMPREREVADVGAVVTDAVNSFPLNQAEVRRCVVLTCERGLHAQLHRDLMNQVIHNLISNAITSLGRKSPLLARGDIQVSVALVDTGVIHIEVTDEGVGIEPDRLRRVFAPFESTSHVPTHGLGLVMCKNAITSFGGDIYCTSVLGESATFIIELPRITRSAPGAPAA